MMMYLFNISNFKNGLHLTLLIIYFLCIKTGYLTFSPSWVSQIMQIANSTDL